MSASSTRIVVIDGTVIGTDAADAGVIDAGRSGPGARFHRCPYPPARPSVPRATVLGRVTTGLDMACWPPELVASLRDVPGLTDVRSAGVPAVGAVSHRRRMVAYRWNGIIHARARRACLSPAGRRGRRLHQDRGRGPVRRRARPGHDERSRRGGTVRDKGRGPCHRVHCSFCSK